MTDTVYIIILLVMGLGAAYLTARSSINKEKIHGGAASQLLNYLASGLIAMLAPTVLCNVIFIHPDFLKPILPFLDSSPGFIVTFVHLLAIVLLMVGIALLLLMLMAMIEKPLLDKVAPKEDKGWTKEDAETSGL